MLSSRNDWNYNAGMDESLNTHKGGGVRIFLSGETLWGVRISCARYRAFQAAYVCAAFFACF